MGPKAKSEMIADRHPSDAERRRAPRVFVDLEVDYASEDNYLFAYITDISATGIFVRTTTPEAPGTHLNLRFTTHSLPGTFDEAEPDTDEIEAAMADARVIESMAIDSGAIDAR